MKLTMFDAVFRPIKTSRRLMALMKAIELEPTFKAQNGKERHQSTSEFMVLTSSVMMPVGVYNMIAPSLVAVEMDGYSPATFKRRKSQSLSIYEVTYANALSMLVAERLEEK